MTAPQPPTAGRTIWPGIGRGLAHDDLPKHLFTVAAMHARRALAAAKERFAPTCWSSTQTGRRDRNRTEHPLRSWSLAFWLSGRVQDGQSHCTAEYSVSPAVPGPPLTTGTAAPMSVRHTVMTRARLWG